MTRQYSVRCVRPAPVSRSLNHYPVYSLIGTCKLNDVDPESYLRHVPGVIADWPVNRVSELLPWRIALPAE
ncbi:transposase domain-containing protein [Escherichia coli]